MTARDKQPTDEKLWGVLDKLRGVEFRDPEELAAFLKKENVRFSGHDLTKLGYILTTRLGRSAGMYYVPEWLASIFSSLLDGLSPKVICDPWAGIGLLVATLRETSEANEVLAFAPNQAEHSLGSVLVPDVNWQVGDPLHLLDALDTELDLAASILPMGARATNPLAVPVASGATVQLSDDLGHLLLVAASSRLSASGVGLFVVTPKFFFSERSVFRQFAELGLGVEAALALPPGTFAPYTSIPSYLVKVRRNPKTRLFVAQLSSDANTNLQILSNLREAKEGGSPELGRFVAPDSFTGIEAILAAEKLVAAERRFGSPALTLGQIATSIKLGRPGDDFEFPRVKNGIFVPMIGNSDVLDSPDELTLKKQNYAQVAIDPARSKAGFVSRFLNSDFGKELREQHKSGVIPKLNKQTLAALPVFLPDLPTQHEILEVETGITTEQNTVMSLQNELAELRRELWASPNVVQNVQQRLSEVASRLAGEVKRHTSESFEHWFESLPFPLASILRAWQATPSQDFKTKHEHLLHFFEATTEFVGVILLSAFGSNAVIFEPHRQKLREAMQKQSLSFERATFGTWKLVVEYLGKQTRMLLNENGKKADIAKDDRSICAELFADASVSLPEVLSRKELADIISATNKMRNDWGGHGGVVGQGEAKSRNQQLVAELEKLREVFADTWTETHLIHSLHCRPKRGVFENEIAVLMGSNGEFLKETRELATWLDVERLYLGRKGNSRALKLLPLVQVGSSPESAKNACYFFSRLERNGARFVSYHYADKPELTGEFTDAAETIKSLIEV